MLTRDQILGASPFQPRFAEVDVPALGGTVRIRNVSEGERGRMEVRYHMATTDAAREQALREEPVRWIIQCVVNSEGLRLFTAKDVPELMALDAAVTRTIYQAIKEHCGVGPAAPTVEDHEKNSAATDDGSSSGE
jgi:hypothetical protein